MFILIYFLVVALSQLVTNKMLGLNDSNEENYSYSKKDSLILAILLAVSILLQIFARRIEFLKAAYWYICIGYFIVALIIMFIFMTARKNTIERQREEIKQIYEILQKMVDKKNEGLDFNNVPFTLKYKYGKINRIDVKVEPTTFDEKILSLILQQLNNFLPTFTWAYELHLEERYMTFIGNDKPPELARWPGSWLRPLKAFPVGISGNGELCWQPDSVDKRSLGRSLFLDEKGNPIKEDLSLSKAPQGLVAGGPLDINTLIPTTKGVIKLKDIVPGDYVFDIFNRPTRVITVYGKRIANVAYKLVFSNDVDTFTVITDAVHRFPKIYDSELVLTEAQNLQIDDYVIGNQYNYKLIDIIKLRDVETMCIATSSDKHIFLLSDQMYEHWAGGECFPFNGIYTANTGGGKAIWIEQEIDQ